MKRPAHIVSQIKMIEGNDEVRAKKCQEAIHRVLSYFDCLLIPLVQIKPGGITGNFEVFPIPRNKKKEEN